MFEAATSGVFQDISIVERRSAEAIERRRMRNRETMRRLREDPAYRVLEKKRREARLSGHALPAELNTVACVKQEAPRKCAICRKRNAVETVTRLRPSAEVRSGFVSIRIAYCGFC
jgi:hypothetical protein